MCVRGNGGVAAVNLNDWPRSPAVMASSDNNSRFVLANLSAFCHAQWRTIFFFANRPTACDVRFTPKSGNR
jgi:hypothetical protein